MGDVHRRSSDYEFGGQSVLLNGDVVHLGHDVLSGHLRVPGTVPVRLHHELRGPRVFRLSSDGSNRISAAVWGGSYSSYTYGTGGTVNPTTGDVYVTGQAYNAGSYYWPFGNGGYFTGYWGYGDPFITRLNGDFSQYLNSTIVPTDSYYYDTGLYLALDGSGNVYVSASRRTHTRRGGARTRRPGRQLRPLRRQYGPDLMSSTTTRRLAAPRPIDGRLQQLTSFPDFYYNTANSGIIVDGSDGVGRGRVGLDGLADDAGCLRDDERRRLRRRSCSR